MTIVEMRVHMDCPGCETKIKKALSKLDGVDSIDIDMKTQKVTVMGWVDQKKVLKTVRKKTGRKAELWPYPYNPEYHDYNHRYYNTQYAAEPPSTYNYHEHGYNGHEHGYYQLPPSAVVVDDRASAMFSDENVNSCYIM